MLKHLNRLLLSFSSTSWMLVVYAIKTHYHFFFIPEVAFHLILIIMVSLISIAVLQLTKIYELDNLEKCNSFDLSDSEFLPVYLGYFFVALSINDFYTMVFVFLMVWIVTTMLDTYFNPAFILLGYHYYHATSINGTQLFIISKSKERNAEKVSFKDLRRINNRTYISHGGME